MDADGSLRDNYTWKYHYIYCSGCHNCFIVLDSNQDKDKSATEETTNQDDVYSQIKKFQVCNTFFVDSTSAHIA